MIKCSDVGVRMIEAKARGSLEEWLTNVGREKELMLVYWEEMYHKPYFWSTFYVQLTEFEDGGLAIGLSCRSNLCNHVLQSLGWQDVLGQDDASYIFPPIASAGAGKQKAEPKALSCLDQQVISPCRHKTQNYCSCFIGRYGSGLYGHGPASPLVQLANQAQHCLRSLLGSFRFVLAT
ncbi:hypothetical protein ACFX19_017322 [Malus domestica]